MSNKKLFGISFLVNFTFSMLTTLLSLIVYDINQKSSDITFVKGAFICSLILVRALQFKNSFPPLTNICVGSALFTLGCFILTIQYHNFIWMILGAMLFGVAIGLVPPAILTMISDNENPDLNLGIYNSIVAISSIFSPLVGETIYKINPQSIFIGWFISSLLMTIVAFTISPKSIQVKESRNETNKQSISSVLNKEFLMMFFVLFFTSISYGSIVSYLPIYFKDIGGSIGIYYLFFWSGYIIVQVLKSVNYSRKMILMAICFCVLGQTCLILFNFTLFLYLTALFYGIGYGTLFKVFYSRIGRFKSEISRNIGFSVIGLISYLGVGFAPVFLLPLNTGTWKLLFIGSTTYSIIALFI
ncbi:TPA: MFS transporter, partial [Streptococcus agalactiae]|nr:MFS transporter [Streptococcus agalactiae]